MLVMSTVASCKHDLLVGCAWQGRAEEKRDDMKQELANSQAEWSKTLEQAQLSHHALVQGLQQQLHDASEGRTAAEGELTRKSGLYSLQCMPPKTSTDQFRICIDGRLSCPAQV